ncbi:MAG TPA: hypothetical protein VG053_09705 [Solirubrobacteraceae bacterium]|nr:hypothetical protein [Solirubrobacteraceae bacterium]
MSTDPVQAASEPGAGEPSGQPSEEDRSEIGQRAAYEAEISRVTSTDMILQAVVSLLNIGGHRLGLTSEGGATAGESSRDLEQVRDAIDGVRALLPILERREPESLRPLRDALSQLQMAYARAAGASAPTAERPGEAAATGEQAAPAAKPASSPDREKPADGPGPAQASGRLWVPGR